jgi:hypothetical protein
MPNHLKTLIAIILLTLLCATSFVLYKIYTKGWVQVVTALPHLPVRCPPKKTAILVIGQSQASNTGQYRRIPNYDKAFAFADGKCFHLRDPVPGTLGRSGSIWPIFVDNLKSEIIIANISISGSSIEQWTTKAAKYKIASTIRSLNQAGYSAPIIILMQGETNAGLKTSRASYRNSLKKLIGVAPYHKWLITRESICFDNQTKWHPLDEARNDVALQNKNIVIGPDLDKIPLNMRLNDRCHLQKSGQDWLAMQMSVYVRRMMTFE